MANNERFHLTTGQAAKICGVSNRTIMKWFDSKMLGGFIIPGGRDRRIPRQALMDFMREHGMPELEANHDT